MKKLLFLLLLFALVLGSVGYIKSQQGMILTHSWGVELVLLKGGWRIYRINWAQWPLRYYHHDQRPNWVDWTKAGPLTNKFGKVVTR